MILNAIRRNMPRENIFEPIPIESAINILGKNCFFVKEWELFFGANCPYPIVRNAELFPWGEEMLRASCPLPNCGRAVKDCHFGFLEPTFVSVPAHHTPHPLNIMHLHTIQAQPQTFYYDNPWYRNEEFANFVSKEWLLVPHLVHLNVVLATTMDLFDFQPDENEDDEEGVPLDPKEQNAALGARHEFPSAQTELLKELLYFIKNGVYLNHNLYARVKGVSSGGLFTTVGSLGQFGFIISNWGGTPDHKIGFGASLKQRF